MENWYKPGPVHCRQMTEEERKHYTTKKAKVSDKRMESDIETYQPIRYSRLGSGYITPTRRFTGGDDKKCGTLLNIRSTGLV